MNHVTIVCTAILMVASSICADSAPVQKSSGNSSRPSSRATFQRNASEMAETIESVSAPVLPSIVSVDRGRRRISLGLIVSTDGEVLTKLSSLREGFQIDIGGTKYSEVKVVGIHKKLDLALLKVNAADLVPIQFSVTKPEVGNWLITPTLDESVGLMGMSCTEVVRAKSPGLLGVMIKDVELDDHSTEVEITQVIKKSAAEFAGLKVGDIIQSVAGQRVTSRKDLLARLSDFSATEACSITIIRNGVEIIRCVELAERFPLNSGSVERGLRTKFPVAFGHDTKLVRNTHCGGPIINLAGEVVGINTLGQFRGVDLSAKSPAPPPGQGRSISMSMSNLCLAIPSEFITATLEQLSDGTLAPAQVNRELISAKELKIEEYSAQIENLKAQAEDNGEGFNNIAESKIIEMKKKRRQMEIAKERLVRGF